MSDEALVTTRLALHALAAQVISPLRVQATGNEIALQVRPGGFGTPAPPDGSWVGVSGTEVVRLGAGGDEQRTGITSLRAAALFVGLVGGASLSNDPLEVHAGAASVLAEAWAIGEEALIAFAADGAEDPSPPILWPEHFDVAIEAGSKAASTRATYGISPGDADHDEPYAYVAPWTPPEPTGPATFWNATAFTGAERPVGADDAGELVAFFREAARLLGG
ncbi:MAG: hypothetical protein ABW167_10430 [Baekduia sp.]